MTPQIYPIILFLWTNKLSKQLLGMLRIPSSHLRYIQLHCEILSKYFVQGLCKSTKFHSGSWCDKTLQSLKSKSFIKTNKFFFGLKTLLNDLLKLFLLCELNAWDRNIMSEIMKEALTSNAIKYFNFNFQIKLLCFTGENSESHI